MIAPLTVAAIVPAPSRRLADRRRADAPRAVRQAAAARHAPADGGSGTGLGLRQRAPLQRDFSQPLSPSAQRPPAKGSRHVGARWRDAATGLSAALRLVGNAIGALVARDAWHRVDRQGRLASPHRHRRQAQQRLGGAFART